MNSPTTLDQQFQAAVERVNNLPADTAPAQMTDLYGLYKQATAGDVDMKGDAVAADQATDASGPAGLSQGQWDSWNKYKGTPQDEAKRQYVARAAEAAGGPAGAAPAQTIPTDGQTGAPSTTDHGGLRGDLTEGAPYGGEDKLKDAQ
ncbi:acyl-CoA-binding protein [Hymenobacter caeli]|uniref:Acyl-CoA-binding protein n=1 Tax=Hymenobacter caeli TaxID=2735894 RepID=A0ABX2FJF1_9BACT|nr:acyl-CoA-binding protein [Hymenobacter caeli]NRT17250.1 acyl-CoA-binding protein [Hymenobacter caeli]